MTSYHAAEGWLSVSGGALLALVAFVANLGWETAHGGLYVCDLTAWRHLRAAGGDVVLITGTVVAARRLGGAFGTSFWVVLVGVLAAGAVTIELAALGTGYWAYTQAMPVLGPVGLSPVVQLPLTAVIATLAARWVDRRFGGGTASLGGMP